MSQYFIIANIDKQEKFDPSYFGPSTLMGWSWEKDEPAIALINLLATRWRGDRVYVIGDYADVNDCGSPYHKAITSLAKSHKLDKNSIVFNHVSGNKFKNISQKVECSTSKYRYIYNHAKGIYIDLKHCPIECIEQDKDSGEYYAKKVSPLPILLAMGNGHGFGDYRGYRGKEYAGTWCDSVKSIEITKKPLNVDYKEFRPDFTFNKTIIPYTEEKLLIQKEKDEYVERIE